MTVMICVNNPDNGMFCGRCCAIDVADFMSLEAVVLPEPRCTISSKHFSIHRHKTQFQSHQCWVGNWCWDAIEISRKQVAELLAVALRQQWSGHSVWSIQEAQGECAIALSSQRDMGIEITAAAIETAMRKERVA